MNGTHKAQRAITGRDRICCPAPCRPRFKSILEPVSQRRAGVIGHGPAIHRQEQRSPGRLQCLHEDTRVEKQRHHAPGEKGIDRSWSTGRDTNGYAPKSRRLVRADLANARLVARNGYATDRIQAGHIRHERSFTPLKTPLTKNVSLIPSDGIERQAIAPCHGIARPSPIPPHGAIRALFVNSLSRQTVTI